MTDSKQETLSKVRIYNDQGDQTEYVPLSERLHLFHKAFPYEDGFRVKVEALNILDTMPGLAKLYERAVENSLSPRNIGLPDINPNEYVFKASLLNKEGEVIESGSSRRTVIMLKDWEKAETSARQRLIAALGFGGDVLDSDEKGDISDQGFSTYPDEQTRPDSQVTESVTEQNKVKKKSRSRKKEPAPSESVSENDESADRPSTETSDLVDAESSFTNESDDDEKSVEETLSFAEPEGEAEVSEQSAEAVPEKSSGAKAEATTSFLDSDDEVITEDGNTVPEYIIRQIKHKVGVLGTDDQVPETFRSLEHAREVMKNLMLAK